MHAIPHRRRPERTSVQPPDRLSASKLIAVLMTAAGARLLVLWIVLSKYGAPWLYTRGVESGFVARSLVLQHAFASPFGGNTGPTALISPGYVWLVATIFRLFGIYSSASAVTLLILQIALGVATCWLIMLLAHQLQNSRTALLAGTYWALWPPLLWIPTIFWDTSLTLCLLPAMILLALKLRKHPTQARWLLLGSACGLSLLVNLALFSVVLGLFGWCIWNHSSGQRKHILLAATVALCIYAPWPIRNECVFHRFIPLRTTVGLELWMGNRDGASGYLDESIFPFANPVEARAYRQQGEIAYMHAKSLAASAWIRLHPAQFIRLTTLRFLRFWTGSGTRGSSPLFAIGGILTSALGLAGLGTLFYCGRSREATLFLILIVVFPLPYYITHAEFRYRLALEPVLQALGFFFVAQLLEACQQSCLFSKLPANRFCGGEAL